MGNAEYMGIHQQHSKPAYQTPHPAFFAPFKKHHHEVLRRLCSLRAGLCPGLWSVGLALGFPGRRLVNPSISPIIVASNAPIYYPVIYTYDTSAASGPAPFKFFWHFDRGWISVPT